MLHSTSYAAAVDGALAVAVSRSGSTTELVSAVERLKDSTDVPVLALCATGGSPLSALSDLALEMPWCFDHSVCQTRTVSCLYLAGMGLIARLSGNETLADGLKRAVAGGPAYLSRVEADLAAVARLPWSQAVLLADAELAGIAEEGALAFQEISRRPGSFHHLLDVRHGPMVLVGPDTLVIAALAEGNQHEHALLADVAKKGAHLVVYSDIPMDGLPDGALNLSFGRSLPQVARGLPLILIAQLTAYYRAVADGVNPDAPDGLEPWILL
jgi:fructoselysine-6-P-deglycase FrlB-like protein